MSFGALICVGQSGFGLKGRPSPLWLLGQHITSHQQICQHTNNNTHHKHTHTHIHTPTHKPTHHTHRHTHPHTHTHTPPHTHTHTQTVLCTEGHCAVCKL